MSVLDYATPKTSGDGSPLLVIRIYRNARSHGGQRVLLALVSTLLCLVWVFKYNRAIEQNSFLLGGLLWLMTLSLLIGSVA